MKLVLALLSIGLCGCSISKINKPPQWGSAIISHERFLGVSASYQGYGLRLGWGSTVWCVIPVSTNQIYAAPISDTCKIGTIETTITEDLQTFPPGGQPPTPRFQRLFSPKDKP